MGKPLFDAVIGYGQKYRERHLNNIDPAKLASNFWPALDFFLSRACFQGRRDAVSKKVYQAIIEVLEPEFSVSGQAANYIANRRQKWKSLEGALKGRIGKGHVGKARDIHMVLSTLEFVGQLPDWNIVKYSVEQIKQGNLGKHYAELQASNNGITQVGSKIAAFYLRDVIALYSLDDKVAVDSAYCIQPVDTWVRKLAYRLKIVDEGANDQTIQKAIVEFCQSKGLSPILFNQGAWYIGYYSYDIALDLLGTKG